MARSRSKKNSSGKKIGALTIILIIFGSIIGLIVVGAVGNFVYNKVTSILDDGDDDKNDTIPDNNKDPVSILTADSYRAKLGIPINFDGNESYDPGYTGNLSNRGIMFYMWDYGYNSEDGTPTQETTVNGTTLHTFPERGEFTVTLTVIDESERENSASVMITIVPPDLVITSGSSVLIGDPLGPGVIGNKTEINWTIEEGATAMWLNVTVSGANFLEGQQNHLEIILEDPYFNVLANRTITVMGKEIAEFTFSPDELTLFGSYNLVIQAYKGTALVSVVGGVTYI